MSLRAWFIYSLWLRFLRGGRLLIFLQCRAGWPLFEVRRLARHVAGAGEALSHGHHVPADHHGVVLMDDVVAVHDVFPEEVAPAHVDYYFVIRQQGRYIAPLPAHENVDLRAGRAV